MAFGQCTRQCCNPTCSNQVRTLYRQSPEAFDAFLSALLAVSTPAPGTPRLNCNVGVPLAPSARAGDGRSATKRHSTATHARPVQVSGWIAIRLSLPSSFWWRQQQQRCTCTCSRADHVASLDSEGICARIADLTATGSWKKESVTSHCCDGTATAIGGCTTAAGSPAACIQSGWPLAGAGKADRIHDRDKHTRHIRTYLHPYPQAAAKPKCPRQWTARLRHRCPRILYRGRRAYSKRRKRGPSRRCRSSRSQIKCSSSSSSSNSSSRLHLCSRPNRNSQARRRARERRRDRR